MIHFKPKERGSKSNDKRIITITQKKYVQNNIFEKPFKIGMIQYLEIANTASI